QPPTPNQAAVLPTALGKRCDIFGAAQTGSGKTLAFALPILQRILDSTSFNGPAEGRHLAALILSPTRELALQVTLNPTP
ncbi:P-loop containing nucleoside triphosphate hydrolase protein, partial [Baffinella frigidus]